MLDTKQIVGICTDGVNYYTGMYTGMYERMLVDNNYIPKLIHMHDFSHRTELLLKKSLPDFVTNNMQQTYAIVSTFNSKSVIQNLFHQFRNSQDQFVFVNSVKQSKTRYIEYSHTHISSVF